MIRAGILRSDERIHCHTVLVSTGLHNVGGNLFSVKPHAVRFDVTAGLPHKSREAREAGGGSEGANFQEASSAAAMYHRIPTLAHVAIKI